MKLLVSACLMGVHCRYDGKNNAIPQLKRLLSEYTCIPVCPEILGGLPTPRLPAERQKDRVINRNGEDVTDAFVRGTAETLRLAKLCGCTAALLKENSPSCGCGAIYDGSFSGNLIEGDGLTAQMLKRHGITVYGESQIEALIPPEDDLLFGTMLGLREELREEERVALQTAREVGEAKAKAEAEAAAAAAAAEAAAIAAAQEAQAAAVAAALEAQNAAAQEAQNAAVAAALEEDGFKFTPIQEMDGEGSEEDNPFSTLIHLGIIERVAKPEPTTVPEGEDNIAYFPNDKKGGAAVWMGEAPSEGETSPETEPTAEEPEPT